MPGTPIDAGLTTVPVVWERTGDGEFPYRSTVDGRRLTIRVNDFPAEPLYTLLESGRIDGLDLEDWPPAWTKAKA